MVFRVAMVLVVCLSATQARVDLAPNQEQQQHHRPLPAFAHSGRPTATATADSDSGSTDSPQMMIACPNQAATEEFTAAAFGPIYPTSDSVGVQFSTSDADLQRSYDHAIQCELGNGKEFLPGLANVVEGAGYGNVWLETQPMAGAMWAVRNLTQALANQLVFMRTQRADGRLPGMVTTNAKAGSPGTALTAEYCMGPQSLLQGQYFALPAVDVGWFMNITRPRPTTVTVQYLTELAGVLERFDGWLRSHRASPAPGKLAGTFFLWSPTDWGGDNSDVYRGYTAPFASMDMAAYAYSNTHARSRVATMLGNATAAVHWDGVAATIAGAFKRALWSEARGASFDIETAPNGKVVDVLMHNNLRCMWHGVFDQPMAEAFVAKHLRNPAEFWTAFPLPSIAVNDPHYAPGLPRNNWSGPAEGLTYQRAVRALENYGFHAEVTLLGGKLAEVVNRSGTFPQQWNPQAWDGIPAGAAASGDCYGPALLALLEFTSHTHGVKPRPADSTLLWSDALPVDPHSAVAHATAPATTATYTQQLGAHAWTLAAGESTGTFTGSRDGEPLFGCTRGVRVVTALETSTVVGVVGISTVPVAIRLVVHASGRTITGTVDPNTEYAVDGSTLVVTRRVPFAPPV